MSWFDSIPAALRHYLIGLAALVAAAVLTYVGAHYTEWTDLPDVVKATIAMFVPLIPVAVLALTKISRQYGVGSDDAQISSEGNDTVPPPEAQTDHTDVAVPVTEDPVADPVPPVAESEPSDPSAL